MPQDHDAAVCGRAGGHRPVPRHLQRPGRPRPRRHPGLSPRAAGQRDHPPVAGRGRGRSPPWRLPWPRWPHRTGWTHSTWDHRRVIHVGPGKVHLDVQFTRHRGDGTVVGVYPAVYVIVEADGRVAHPGPLQLRPVRREPRGSRQVVEARMSPWSARVPIGRSRRVPPLVSPWRDGPELHGRCSSADRALADEGQHPSQKSSSWRTSSVTGHTRTSWTPASRNAASFSANASAGPTGRRSRRTSSGRCTVGTIAPGTPPRPRRRRR